MKKSIIVSHIVVTVLLIFVLVNTLLTLADSRQTLFSVAHIAYVQDVSEALSTNDLSPTTIGILARQANLIKLSVRDGLGSGGIAKDTLAMIEIVEDSLTELQQLVENDLAADAKIADLISFTNQAKQHGRDILDANGSFKLMWLIK